MAESAKGNPGIEGRKRRCAGSRYYGGAQAHVEGVCIRTPDIAASEGEEGGFNVGFKALFGGIPLVFPSLLEHSVLMSSYVIPYNCAKFCTGSGLVGRFDFINTV